MQPLAYLDHGNVLGNTRATHGLTAVLPTANSDLAVPALAAKHRTVDVLGHPSDSRFRPDRCTPCPAPCIAWRSEWRSPSQSLDTLSAIYVDTVLTQGGNAVAVVFRFSINILDLDILAAVVHHVVDVTGAGCRTSHTSRTY